MFVCFDDGWPAASEMDVLWVWVAGRWRRGGEVNVFTDNGVMGWVRVAVRVCSDCIGSKEVQLFSTNSFCNNILSTSRSIC